MTLIVAAVAWLFGLWLGDALHLPAVLGGGVAMAGGLLALVGRKNARVWLAAVGVIALGLAFGRMAWAQPNFAPHHIQRLIGEQLQLEGVITQEPRWTPTEQRLVMRVENVVVAGQIKPADGLLQVELPPEPPRRIGERLVLNGTLAAPRSGRGFDYAAYLARHGIFVLLDKPTLETVAPPTNSPLASLRSFKENTRRVILRTVPEPEASLLVGILLGIQSSIPPAVWQTFNRTGTSHILVISGWNISIIVITLLAIGKRLGWRNGTATGAALAVVVVYVVLVGASPSVLRAALMGGIVALANPLHRRADPWTAIAAACLIMTLIDPNTLWDVGFQLSSLATASLFAWGKTVERGVKRVIRGRWLEWMIEPLTATLAAQVWALPIILYSFGNLSLVAPLANVLMVPVVPLAMGAGAALATLGLLWRPLALLLLPLAWATLAWLVTVARLLAGTTWAAVSLPPFGIVWILGFYALTLVGWARLHHVQRRAKPDDDSATLATQQTAESPA